MSRSPARRDPPTVTAASGALAQLQITSVTQVGPLPAPEILAGYEMVEAGTANRVIAMAEREQVHRHEQETRALEANVDLARRGQVAGTLIGITGFAAAVILGVFGQPWAAGVVAALDVGGIIAALALGRRRAARPAPTERQPPAPPASITSGANRDQRRADRRRR